MVAIGKHNLKLSEEDAKIYDVVKILIHPEWSTNTTKYDADIAILELSREVIFNSFIQPICLPTLEEKNFEELGIVVSKQQQKLVFFFFWEILESGEIPLRHCEYYFCSCIILHIM